MYNYYPTIILPSGYLIFGFIFEFLDNNATNIVREPTLPKNINIIIIIFPALVNSGVPPILSPTVAKADTTSNVDSSSVNPGFPMLHIHIPNNTVNTPIKKSPQDFFPVASLILL